MNWVIGNACLNSDNNVLYHCVNDFRFNVGLIIVSTVKLEYLATIKSKVEASTSLTENST